jgi:hypothetical protein
MIAFKEFAIGKFVLRFYKTDHVWTCTVMENMLDEVTKELALQKLSDIGQEIERELTEDEIREVADSVCHTWKKNGVGELYMTDFARAILKKASDK